MTTPRELFSALLERDCATCSSCLGISAYKFSEWIKGEGRSRCKNCTTVATIFCSKAPDITAETTRHNRAIAAEYDDADLDKPFAEGTFKYAAKGVYSEGGRKGQPCVCKWFKSGSVFEARYFDRDLDTVDEAIRLVSLWNSQKIINKAVKMNLPEIWTFDSTSTRGWAGKKIMQEPFIEEWQKFNSGSGWNDSSNSWARAMQALSHFSYDVTNGQSLLCDLQGAVYQNGVVLTDPAILSVSGEFGPTDLGLKGISTFFCHHVCNEYCRSFWLRPRDQTCYYQKRKGTSMDHVSLRYSRNRLSTEFSLLPSKRRKYASL